MNTFAKLLTSTLFGLTLLGTGCGNNDPGPGGGTPPPPPPNKCGSCARYEVCMTSGVCGINPSSTWLFAVDSVTVASTKTDGSTWDAFGGAPDPFVQLDTKRTTTKQDTFTATFGEGTSYTATNLLNQGVAVTVYDEDVSANDLIGGPTTVRPTEADLRSGTLTVTNLGQAQRITFTMTPQ